MNALTLADAHQKQEEQNQNFLGQHEAESQEAGTAHRLLAKAREGLYVSERNNRSLAVKSMAFGDMNHGSTTRIM